MFLNRAKYFVAMELRLFGTVSMPWVELVEAGHGIMVLSGYFQALSRSAKAASYFSKKTHHSFGTSLQVHPVQ